MITKLENVKIELTEGMVYDPAYEFVLRQAKGETAEQKLKNLLNNCKDDLELAIEIAQIENKRFAKNVFIEILDNLSEPYNPLENFGKNESKF